jgi:hypothetical protein
MSRERLRQRRPSTPKRRGHNLRDLTGQQCSRLTVLKRAANDRHNKAQWFCACECGDQATIGGANLIKGIARSCGCLRKEVARRSRLSHGMSSSRVYTIYCAAKLRCGNPNNWNYAYYGGRGIRFLYTSFEQFYSDVGEPPPGGTLERCDNDDHYEPGNCRWATQREQNNNKRSNYRVTAFGRTQTLSRWAREFKLKPHTLRHRIKIGVGCRESSDHAGPMESVEPARRHRRMDGGRAMTTRAHRRRPEPPRPTFTLKIEGRPGADSIRDLRALLKRLLRQHGFRCVEALEHKDGGRQS